MKLPKAYNYFQYVDENTTRYIGFYNADPQMSMVPAWLINFVVSKVLWEQCILIQKWAENLKNTPFLKRIEEKPEFYERIDFAVKSNYDLSELEIVVDEFRKKQRSTKEKEEICT